MTCKQKKKQKIYQNHPPKTQLCGAFLKRVRSSACLRKPQQHLCSGESVWFLSVIDIKLITPSYQNKGKLNYILLNLYWFLCDNQWYRYFMHLKTRGQNTPKPNLFPLHYLLLDIVSSIIPYSPSLLDLVTSDFFLRLVEFFPSIWCLNSSLPWSCVFLQSSHHITIDLSSRLIGRRIYPHYLHFRFLPFILQPSEPVVPPLTVTASAVVPPIS